MQPETLWEKLKQNLRESAVTAAEKAEHIGKLGRVRLDIARTRHAMHEAFGQLGTRTYALLGENPETMPGQREDVQHLIQTIKALEVQLQSQEAELKILQSAGATPEST